MTDHSTIALVVAAGRGARAGGGLPKQYRVVGGKPVLRRTLEALLQHPAIDTARVVIHPDDRQLYDAAVVGLGLAEPIAGGATRQASVRLGLEAIATAGGAARVLIHDAARPFVSRAVIDRVLAALATEVGAVPALAVVDSLRRGASPAPSAGSAAPLASGARPSVPDGGCGSPAGATDSTDAAQSLCYVAAEVDRSDLYQVQTPQGFCFAAILAAHRAASGQATDDAEVLRAAGGRIALTQGDEANVKLTTSGDFARAEAMLAGATATRTGFGYDVHRFGAGDHVWLCGVRLPHSQGLIGHSDADAGLHALTDALLGCIGAGDIGQHFPPSDLRWRGASSDRFLVHANELVRAHRGRVEHVDITLICERPKIGPHREAMRKRIADLLELPLSCVSVKATTTEGLGFTGRNEGLAAQAVATVRLPREERP